MHKTLNGISICGSRIFWELLSHSTIMRLRYGDLDRPIAIVFVALLPHELFAHLYEWDRKMFDQVFFSTPIHEVETFWRNLNAWNPEWWNVHPLKAEVMLDPTRSQELFND